MMLYDTKGLFFFLSFTSGYFQNVSHKTTFIEHFLENSLNNAHMTIFSISYSYNVAYNSYEEVNALFYQIGLPIAKVSMLKAINTWVES